MPPAVVPMMMMMMVVVPMRLLLALPPLFQRAGDLLFLLLDQVLLHGILIIMVAHQLRKFLLLLEHRPPPFQLLLLGIASPSLPPPPPLIIIRITTILYPSLLPNHRRRNIVLLALVVAPLVPHMVDAQHAAHDRGAAQVVDSEVGAALVLVLEEGEAPALARLLVPDEVDVDGLAELREDGHDVALGELVGEPADVDPGRVAVVGVPGGFGGAVCVVNTLALVIAYILNSK